MRIQISTSALPIKQLVAEGKMQKIELYASTSGKFAERLANFIKEVGEYTSGGSSRSIGILDASSDEERALKLFIDGDGSDRIRDVKLLE